MAHKKKSTSCTHSAVGALLRPDFAARTDLLAMAGAWFDPGDRAQIAPKVIDGRGSGRIASKPLSEVNA